MQVIVEHVLSGRPGEWRVSIVGSRAKEDWTMKVEGPNGFEANPADWKQKQENINLWPSGICYGGYPTKDV